MTSRHVLLNPEYIWLKYTLNRCFMTSTYVNSFEDLNEQDTLLGLVCELIYEKRGKVNAKTNSLFWENRAECSNFSLVRQPEISFITNCTCHFIGVFNKHYTRTECVEAYTICRLWLNWKFTILFSFTVDLLTLLSCVIERKF